MSNVERKPILASCDACKQEVCQTCGACRNSKCDMYACPEETVNILNERRHYQDEEKHYQTVLVVDESRRYQNEGRTG